jgi:hypothetical protein
MMFRACPGGQSFSGVGAGGGGEAVWAEARAGIRNIANRHAIPAHPRPGVRCCRVLICVSSILHPLGVTDRRAA